MQNNNDTCEISSITFGIFSKKEILDMSVCKIDNPKKTGYNTVYDERLGSINSLKNCETCGETAMLCNGHFGHIEFNEMIIHPLFYKRVISYLNCICSSCNRLILLKTQIYLSGLNRFRGELRFKKIEEKLKKVIMCCHDDCKTRKSTYKWNVTDNTICKIMEDDEKNNNIIIMSTQEIFEIFDCIQDSDVELLGFNPNSVHPRNFIIQVLPVLPTCARPYVKAGSNICDDDLTNQYIEIIKINNHLGELENMKGKSSYETKKQKYIASLNFRVKTTFNNSHCKAKHSTNGRPIKGIKERLAGKNGQIRCNLMGKRCNQTGRTVIGPEPTLRLGELAVPRDMAEILTIPVRATQFNLVELQGLINRGDVNYLIKPDGKTRINLKRYRRGSRLLLGDIIRRNGKEIKIESEKELVRSGDVVIRNGKILEKILPANRDYLLREGWIVERKLQNGDYVLLNRQPTLHRASMMAMRVVLKPHKTLRMNLAITKPFNADFDGDEMNLHVPQSLESQIELEMLAAAEWNIISSQSGKPNMAIVQDSLLGAYKMTHGDIHIPQSKFFDISLKLNFPQEFANAIKRIQKVLRSEGKNLSPYTGRGLISLFLPSDLIYENQNDVNPQEPVVKIRNGVLYEGTLSKTILGSSHNSLIQIINKEYGSVRASEFIDNIQFVTNQWNLLQLFSIGLGDCLITSQLKKQEIKDVIQKCYIEADCIKTTTNHKIIRELRVNATLGKAKDIGLRIAKDSFNKDNNFVSTINSGSKGDFFNIAQITGLLGQQNLRGKRIPLYFNRGKRTLPHYPFSNLTSEMEYESRGFISSSFIEGLNPREFYFHAMSGREGVSDTAMGTATSGYMQRRIVKLTEDIKIQYDGTARDSTGHIYQIVYGETGFDPIHTTRDGFCNITRIVQRLNNEYEKNKKNGK